MKILKIKTLEKGWTEVEDLILHSCFQIFVDFVDKHPEYKELESVNEKENAYIQSAIVYLYDWWTNIRPNRKDPLDEIEKYPPFEFKEIPDTNLYELKDFDLNEYREYESASKVSHFLDSYWKKEDQEMLHLLVSIREFLWV